MTMLAVKNFFLPSEKRTEPPKFSRMPEAFMRSVRRRSLRAKRTKSLVLVQEKRKSDSFVNSQEWTMSRAVPDLRLGIVGSLSSGKSALVHRYLTGAYMQEESPEGGRFKKEVLVDGQSYLLLIRDEGGPPEMQFAAWVDAVIFVFSLENEASFNAIYTYYHKMAHLRNSTEIPFILVGTQDTISEDSPRVIDDVKARKLSTELKRCSYYETCATYGLNVERVFQDACQKIVQQRLSSSTSCLTPSNSRPSTPLGAPPPGAPLRAQPNVSSLHPSFSPNHANYAHNKDTLSRGHHALSASSNHLHRTMAGPNDNAPQQIVDIHGLNGPDHVRWGHTLASHASTQGLVTIATENNNIAKFTAPACLDNLQLPNTGFKDPKDLPTPSSTPTTTRKTRRRSNLFTPSKKGDDKFKNGELGSGRAIPIKQGCLYKKSSKALNKEWKKKFVALCDDGRLTYHPNINDYMENVHGKEISLQYVTVKVPGQKPRGSKSIITTLPGGHQAYNNGSNIHDGIGGLSLSSYQSKDGKSQRLTDKVLLTAYEVMKEPGKGNIAPAGNLIHDDLSSSSSLIVSTNGDAASAALGSKLETPHVKKRHRRMKSSGLKKDGDGDDQEVYEFCIVSLDGKRWRFEADSCEERDAWVAAVERQILASLQGPGGAEAAISRHVHLVPGNRTCVDCDALDPDWASLNLGVLMCIECSGVHRNLGSHISRVRSLELDEWPPGHLSVMLSIGNSLANSVWEADVRGHSKPVPTSSREEKERWIRLKYERKAFLTPSSDDVGGSCLSALSGDLSPLLEALARARAPDVNQRVGGRAPLHLACAAGDLPVAQLLIWNNANPNLLDADNMSCLQLARLAAAQIGTSPVHLACHLQVTCPIHHAHNNSGANSTNSSTGSTKNLGQQPNSNQNVNKNQQSYSSSPSQSTTCICTLLNMLSPLNSANALIDLLIALQNNSIANSISNNVFANQNIAVASTPLNSSQNTLFGGGNDSHGSGTSLNSNNSAIAGFLIPNNSNTLGRQSNQNNLNLGNGRCQPPIGGSVV